MIPVDCDAFWFCCLTVFPSARKATHDRRVDGGGQTPPFSTPKCRLDAWQPPGFCFLELESALRHPSLT